jgi:hypothetical protein
MDNQTEMLTVEVSDMAKSMDKILEEDQIINTTTDDIQQTETSNDSKNVESLLPAENYDAVKESTQPVNNTQVEDSVPSYLGFYDQQERLYQDNINLRQIVAHEQLIGDRQQYSNLYYGNSAKEDLILKYVANFKRQYTQLYTGRKELLLCTQNEFGVQVSSMPSSFFLKFNF